MKGGKAKPWKAEIRVARDGKSTPRTIAYFAREEDAARAYDRVRIAKLGPAGAGVKSNFPMEEYRAEWARLMALGADGALASERAHAAAERPNAMHKASRFRGVTRVKAAKARPWEAQITVTEDGKRRNIRIARFAREEDAARTFDRVNIAKLGHAEAKLNFSVADYRAEWGQLEALGVDGAVAREKQKANTTAAVPGGPGGPGGQDPGPGLLRSVARHSVSWDSWCLGGGQTEGGGPGGGATGDFSTYIAGSPDPTGPRHP